MSDVTISEVQLAAAHDGAAELVVTLSFDNGGLTRVALDEYAASHLMTACGASSAADLVGKDWRHVRDALDAASHRYS